MPHAQSQAPVQRTGLITGVVVDGMTGDPLAGAVVGIAYPDGEDVVSRRALTDNRGRFAFDALPAANLVTLEASLPGYLFGGFPNLRRPGASTARLSLGEDDWLRDLRIELWKPASISGVVIDERGEPVADVVVRSIAAIRVAGTEQLAAGPAVTTDDRGRYRLSGLLPSRYYVSVPSMPGETPAMGSYPTAPPPADGVRFAHPVVFHPNTTSLAQASAVDVAYGDAISGIDIQLRPTQSVEVSGRVTWPAEAPRSPVLVRLMPSGLESLGFGSEVAISPVGPDGSFRFPDVPIGDFIVTVPPYQAEYSLVDPNLPRTATGPGRFQQGGRRISDVASARAGVRSTSEMAPMTPTETKLWARQAVSVTAPGISDLVVALRGTASIRGHVRFELDPSAAQPSRLGVILQAEPADGDISRGIPEGRTQRDDPTHAFEIRGLAPGPYLITSAGGAAYLVKSVTWNGRDHTHRPFDASSNSALDDVQVVVTNLRGTLTGTVRDSGGSAVGNAVVAVFPRDRSLWANYGLSPNHIQSIPSSPTGEFYFRNLPGGEYLVAAAPPGSDWTAAGFLDAAAVGAEFVRLDWGQSVSRDLTVTWRRP